MCHIWKITFTHLSSSGDSSRGAGTPVSGGASDAGADLDFSVEGNPCNNPGLLPPDYYPPAYSSSSGGGGDQYDSRRGPTRRVPPSVSSSDNNSDTTYAESGDINNSLRARMQALDNRELGSLLPVNENNMKGLMLTV